MKCIAISVYTKNAQEFIAEVLQSGIFQNPLYDIEVNGKAVGSIGVVV
ncbi:MAG: hypothetical protein V8Q17_06435 [Acutalibacteraceae bacterium]